MLRAAIHDSASCSATQAPVIAAVRVPPSAWSTSQSTTICFSPSAPRLVTARGGGRPPRGGRGAKRLPHGGCCSRHADDRPISGDQGGQCRLPPVLPHGRFL